MSGGSYNYLCNSWDVEDLLRHKSDLSDMTDRLAALGYAEDAAKETYLLLVLLRQMETRVEVHLQRLTDVWKAVEWWDSSDWGEDAVKEALAKYRGEIKKGEDR
jgi:hypothetical protein